MLTLTGGTLLIPETDRIEAATKEAKQGGCQLVDLIAWGTQGWERVAELEARIFTLHGYSKIALDVLQNRPWPTPNYEAYRPLEGALSEILAMTQPKR